MVYFIQAGDSGPIKIGICNNIKNRLASLQTGASAKLIILATMEGGQEQEKALHGRFHQDRIRGEWFSPSEEILSFVRITAIQWDEPPCFPRMPRPEHTPRPPREQKPKKTGKRGRPKHIGDQARSARLNIRVRGEYLDWLNRMAIESGALNMTSLLEQMIDEYTRDHNHKPAPIR